MNTRIKKILLCILAFIIANSVHADSNCENILGDWKETITKEDEKNKINDCVDDFLAHGKYFLKINQSKQMTSLYIDSGADVYQYSYDQCNKKGNKYFLRNKTKVHRRPILTIVEVVRKDTEKICLDIWKGETHCFVRLLPEEEKCKVSESENQ